MTSETTINVESSRTDQLSRLPPELLEDIFDYAYFSSPPPPMPVSKHLLPHHQKHFYRQVYLSSPSSVASFIFSITTDEEKGKIVKGIEFGRNEKGVVEPIEVLEKLFPLLPNLKHLGPLPGKIEMGSRAKTLFSSLSKVTSASIEATLGGPDGDFESDYFSLLTALPSLDTLKVLNWPILHDTVLNEEKLFQLKGVKTLSVEGKGAEDEYILNLVNLCPALLHLELVTTYFDDVSFSYCLSHLPSTLESLTLATTRSSFIHPVDLPLLRFTNLRLLDLGDGVYSNTIHKTLQQLPLLKMIRLGGGAISPVGFLTLLSGPARLAHLETIALDFQVGQKGNRVHNLDQLPEGPGMMGWRKPRASELEAEIWTRDDHPLRASQLRQMIQVAREEGIRIEGTIHEALENLEDYWIEANNRAVLSAYRDNLVNHDRLRDIRYEVLDSGLDLPPLGPGRPELVKTELPARDWFIYSLKHVEEAVAEV
ncbi:hypothetical protein JCM5350_006102 [Sporobolomyces pararoseus]